MQEDLKCISIQRRAPPCAPPLLLRDISHSVLVSPLIVFLTLISSEDGKSVREMESPVSSNLVGPPLPLASAHQGDPWCLHLAHVTRAPAAAISPGRLCLLQLFPSPPLGTPEQPPSYSNSLWRQSCAQPRLLPRLGVTERIASS